MDNPTAHARTPSKSPNGNGLQRTPSGRASPVSARAAARKPGRSNLSVSSIPKVTTNLDSSDDDARAQNVALIEELKEQLQKAETASEQYRKQLGVLQMRLDEAVTDQGKLEDHVHEKDSKIEALNAEIREQARHQRDLEQAHELERTAMLRDKEQQASREEELQATIQRLKESLAQKDMRVNNADADKNLSRSCKFPTASSALMMMMMLIPL
jgi:chromosome segregation ATPase